MVAKNRFFHLCGSRACRFLVHQGSSLCGGVPESATDDGQPAGNSDEEFGDETKSAGAGSARAWWPCAFGIGGDEQEFRVRRDVELIDYDDDGAYVALRFRIDTAKENLAP
jgi:hypothetical protein